MKGPVNGRNCERKKDPSKGLPWHSYKCRLSLLSSSFFTQFPTRAEERDEYEESVWGGRRREGKENEKDGQLLVWVWRCESAADEESRETFCKKKEAERWTQRIEGKWCVGFCSFKWPWLSSTHRFTFLLIHLQVSPFLPVSHFGDFLSFSSISSSLFHYERKQNSLLPLMMVH